MLGEEHPQTLLAANNYSVSLIGRKRFKEAKALLRKMLRLARRVLGDNDIITLRMRRNYATSLYHDTGATLVDLREAVPTLEDTERIARRVLGGAHPFVSTVEGALRESRAVLRAREDGKSVVFEYAKRGLA